MSGIALHTGNRVRLKLHPAPANTGIRFRRTDLPGEPEIQGSIGNVIDTRRGTTIGEGEAKVHTVEHLLATLSALGIDNALVEMEGPEPPVLDGSARPFVELVQQAGQREQNAKRRFIELDGPVPYEEGVTTMVLLPDPAFRITCTVKYDSTPLDCQFLSLEINADTFVQELSEARTFCLYREIEPLMAANLISGGSLDNAVVIHGDAILSKDGLRYPDEFVRHKMLDIVGDLYLLGCRLRAHVIAVKPGHPSNVALARIVAGLEEAGT